MPAAKKSATFLCTGFLRVGPASLFWGLPPLPPFRFTFSSTSLLRFCSSHPSFWNAKPYPSLPQLEPLGEGLDLEMESLQLPKPVHGVLVSRATRTQKRLKSG